MPIGCVLLLLWGILLAPGVLPDRSDGGLLDCTDDARPCGALAVQRRLAPLSHARGLFPMSSAFDVGDLLVAYDRDHAAEQTVAAAAAAAAANTTTAGDDGAPSQSSRGAWCAGESARSCKVGAVYRVQLTPTQQQQKEEASRVAVCVLLVETVSRPTHADAAAGGGGGVARRGLPPPPREIGRLAAEPSSMRRSALYSPCRPLFLCATAAVARSRTRATASALPCRRAASAPSRSSGSSRTRSVLFVLHAPAQCLASSSQSDKRCKTELRAAGSTSCSSSACSTHSACHTSP